MLRVRLGGFDTDAMSYVPTAEIDALTGAGPRRRDVAVNYAFGSSSGASDTQASSSV